MLIVIIFTAYLLSCNTTGPVKQKLEIEAEDVSCTEAWIKVSGETGNELILNRDGQEVQRFTINSSPQTIYDDSLQPNKTYTYQTTSIPAFVETSAGGQNQVSSNKINVTTLDTTSHDFTFETYTFGGQAGSCALYDVAIIDGNNIWAVGEIYLLDSLGQVDPNRYNLAVWDGNNWKIKRVPYYYQGQPFYHPIQSIFAFSINDIWFCGNGVIHWDGTQYNPISIPSTIWGPNRMNKIWGISNKDLYVVGDNGSIAHYQNGVWSKIESGTDVDIQDIWGIEDGTSDPFILCAVSNVATLSEHKILKINNTQVDSVKWDTGRRVHSLWFNTMEKLYACGGGVFFGSAPNYSWEEQNDVPLFFTERVRGKGKNDLLVVGDFGLLAHYNGVTWETYPEAATAVIYLSLDYKNNLMVTVGLTQTQAVVQFMFQH